MSRSTFLCAASVSALMSFGCVESVAQPPRGPAVPIEPITAIVDAFQSHNVVALMDAHGNEQAHAFLLSLIRDPRFAATVNDIVVEFGNARYQDVMDRFVRGERIPDDVLRLMWRNTTQAATAQDRPITEDFFRAVRAVNASLPLERQLRVLLGDPPIDWDRVTTEAEHTRWINKRTAYPAALMQVEVLAKDRRALLVYGGMYFQRRNIHTNYDMSTPQSQTVVSLIERATPTKVFTIFRNENLTEVDPDVASWPVPSLAILRGTTLGALDFAEFLRFTLPRFGWEAGEAVPIPRNEWQNVETEEQLDAVLYLGAPSAMTESRLSPELCSEPGYVEMRLKRIALAGLPQVEADVLKRLCGTVASN